MHHYKYIDSEDFYDMACQWIRSKEYEKAEDYLRRVIDLNPSFIYAYIKMANLFAKKKDFHNSVHILKKGTRIDPYFDRLYYLMAKYAYKNEDYKSAIKYISKAIDINPVELYFKAEEIIKEKYFEQSR